jgi:pyridoxine 5'-phosphate synthase PdxJ
MIDFACLIKPQDVWCRKSAPKSPPKAAGRDRPLCRCAAAIRSCSRNRYASRLFIDPDEAQIQAAAVGRAGDRTAHRRYADATSEQEQEELERIRRPYWRASSSA